MKYPKNERKEISRKVKKINIRKERKYTKNERKLISRKERKNYKELSTIQITNLNLSQNNQIPLVKLKKVRI